jgi:hypothetical protein
MAIINDYEAIARRLRELNRATGKGDGPKNWRDLGEEIAKTHVGSGRKTSLADVLRNRSARMVPRRGTTLFNPC